MEKIEKSVNFLVAKHKQTDAKQEETDQHKREVKAIKNLSVLIVTHDKENIK
jgi:hypothetical protein